MKKIVATVALIMGLTFAASAREAVPFSQVYREMQEIVYAEYGGSEQGIRIADAYLFDNYGLTTCGVWFLHDVVGYEGNV